MAAAKIFHHSVFGKIKVFFCTSELQIANDIKLAVEKSDHAILVHETDNIDLIVHVAGFSLPSWSESLNLTTGIQDHLKLASAKKAKLVLVLPDRDNDFIRVAVSLVEQYAKRYKLNYELVFVAPQLSGQDLSRTILEKVFHGFLTLTPTEPVPAIPIPKTPKTKKNRNLWQRLVLIILGFILTTWLIFAGSYFATIGLLSCWQPWCQRSAQITKDIAQAASLVTPGSAQIVQTWLIPMPQLANLSVRSNEVFRLTTGLSLKLTSAQGLLDLSNHKQDLSQALESANYLLADLQAMELPGQWLNNWKNARLEQITSLRQLVVRLDILAGDLPALLGVVKPVRYAIIFQDNTEQRPTGGFIQGFVLLQIAAGKIADIQYFTASETDKLLRGQVTTPVDLQTALGEKNWYLRDANWDPNFVNSARKISWFIDKELGGAPDVVVAVNWQSLAAALSVLGPVNLPNFGGKIGSDNWLDKYQQYGLAESGATNMMVELGRGIASAWETAKPVQKIEVAQYALKLLGARQVFIAPISFTAAGLAQVGWPGDSAVPNCRSQHPCQVLQIQAVDSNVGLNRVNPYVVREHFLYVDVSQDRSEYEYRLSYQNNSPRPAWPMGDYKNFLRVYLPKGVVVGDGDYQVALEDNFVVVKKLLTVPYQKSVELKIKFAQSVPNTDKFHQQIDFINQSGARPEKLEVTYNYPKSWLASPQKQFTVAGAGLLKYNTEVDSPFRLDVDFVKWKNTP